MSVLDYQPPTSTIRRWPFRLAVCGATIVVVLALLNVTASDVHVRVDAVTGTMTTRTTWFNLIPSNSRNVSPLETHLKQAGIPFTPAWQTIGEREYNLFGMILFRGCSTAPPIFQFNCVAADYCKL